MTWLARFIRRLLSSFSSPVDATPSDESDERAVPLGQFDQIFEEEGRGIPLAFLRALARRESSNNPAQQTGPAWGLLQVGIDRRAGNVLQSYNERHSTALTKQDMLDPRLNTRVAADLLSRIVKMYIAEGLTPDWQNGNWIGLVTAGWNTGYSRRTGMVRVIRHLKKQGIPVTLAAAFENAKDVPKGDTPAQNKAIRGFQKRLAQKRRQKWHRSVVASTFREQGRPVTREGSTDNSWMPLLLLALLLQSETTRPLM